MSRGRIQKVDGNENDWLHFADSSDHVKRKNRIAVALVSRHNTSCCCRNFWDASTSMRMPKASTIRLFLHHCRCCGCCCYSQIQCAISDDHDNVFDWDLDLQIEITILKQPFGMPAASAIVAIVHTVNVLAKTSAGPSLAPESWSLRKTPWYS